MILKEQLKSIIKEVMEEYKTSASKGNEKDKLPSLPNLFHGFDSLKDKHDKKKQTTPAPDLEEAMVESDEASREEAVASIRKLQKQGKKYKELAYRRSLDNRQRDAQEARRVAAKFFEKAQELAKQHRIVIEEEVEMPASEEEPSKKKV